MNFQLNYKEKYKKEKTKRRQAQAREREREDEIFKILTDLTKKSSHRLDVIESYEVCVLNL